jgi:hypothetical protein
MARTKQPIYRAELGPEQLQLAIRKLERRIAKLKVFDPKTITENDAWAQSRILANSVKETLEQAFGKDTSDYEKYLQASNFGYTMIIGGTPIQRIIDDFSRNKNGSILGRILINDRQIG